MNYYYSAYGLRIQSVVPLPEFVVAPPDRDVAIRWGDPACIPPEADGKPWYFQITREEAVLFYRDVAGFLVRGGREILVCPAPGAEHTRIRLYLVGTVMAVLLYQRDRLVLHASAVEVEGEAVAFLGISGAGKSSLAAAFHTRGYVVVTDDVAPVTLSGSAAMVSPGFPRLKLYPPLAGTLGCDVDALLFLDTMEEKRGYCIADQFAQTSLPLGRIYVLADGTAPAIEPLIPQEALVELIRHSYPSRLGQCGGVCHFQQCAALAREFTPFRLRKPSSVSSLPDVVRLVEEHLARDRKRDRFRIGSEGLRRRMTAAGGTTR